MNTKLKNFTVYLVGGAVRDQLLGLPVQERDWVVVGATPEEMIARGFRPVGKEFPVFLHPQTHEEYALARTEKKVSKGYKGFTFYTSPTVTLEEDLTRRDLTINAMALSEQQDLIDPFGGQKDLENRILRHVSPAFMEDPVRILRIARFAARFGEFHVAEETNEFMKKMVAIGEVDALVAERVWQEFEKALNEKKPHRFFEVLENCNALKKLFPEIALNGPGITALELAVSQQLDGPLRFAALLHDLSLNVIKNLCSRFKIPLEYSELALLVAEYFPAYLQLEPHSSQDILKLIKATDGLRRPQRFQNFLVACETCTKAQRHEMVKPSSAAILTQALQALQTLDIQPLLQKGLKGKEMGEAIAALQLQAIQKQFHDHNLLEH